MNYVKVQSIYLQVSSSSSVYSLLGLQRKKCVTALNDVNMTGNLHNW